MRIVQFDVDGVLANFYGGYWRVCSTLGIALPPLGSWDDFHDPRVWAHIRYSHMFWLELSELVDRPTMKRISEMNKHEQVYFVTNRQGVTAKRQTEQWLALRGVHNPTVVVTHAKGEFAKAAEVTHSIDDKAGNAVFMAYHSPETKSYLLDAPYNQFNHDALGSKVIRVSKVEDFLTDVEAA